MLPAWSQRIADILAQQPDKSQKGIARACGIKEGSVSGWLGKGKPTKMIRGDNLVLAAAYLGTSPDWIMTGRNREATHQSHQVSIDLDMLQSAIVATKKSFAAFNREMDAYDAAPMMAYAYEERVKFPRLMSRAEYDAFDAMLIEKLRGDFGNVEEGTKPIGSRKRGVMESQATGKATRRGR